MIVLPNRHGAPVHPDQPAGRLIIPLIRAVASIDLGSDGSEGEFTSWRARLPPFLIKEVPGRVGAEILLFWR